MRNVLYIVVLMSTLSAIAEDNVGSVVVMAATQNKIVLGADSMMITFSDNGGRKDSYGECKIAILKGKFIFSAVGRSGHVSDGQPEFTWDSFSLARNVANNSPSGTPLKILAEKWGERVAALHSRDSKRGVIDTRGMIHEDRMESALFAGFVDGRSVIYDVLIAGSTGKGPPTYEAQVKPIEFLPGQLLARGVGDIEAELAAQQTDRAKYWFSNFRAQQTSGASWEVMMAPLVERVIELTIDYSIHKDNVGRPIDVIEVDASGVHWLRKKKECGD